MSSTQWIGFESTDGVDGECGDDVGGGDDEDIDGGGLDGEIISHQWNKNLNSIKLNLVYSY